MIHALTISIHKRFAKFLLCLSAVILSHYPVNATYNETKICQTLLKQALKHPKSIIAPPKSVCPVSSTLAKWIILQHEAAPTEASAFIKDHPNWPRLTTIRQTVEGKFGSEATNAKTILKWFADNPPVSAKGLMVYIAALLENDNRDKAQEVITQHLNTITFDASTLSAFLKTHGSLINPTQAFAKATQLLDNNESVLAKMFLPYLDKTKQEIVNLRVQLINNIPVTVSEEVQDEPTLIFERIRYHRRHKETDTAVKLLIKLDQVDPDPSTLNPEIVWVDRNILGRRLIEEQRYQEAYTLYKNHALKSGENFANGEWLSGWLSLRFLKNLDQAINHFSKLQEGVKSPISLARAYYWLGRSYSEQSDEDSAKSWLTKAQQYPTTYYGQLALKEMTGQIKKLKSKKQPISAETRANFEKNDLVKAIHLLHNMGDQRHAETLLFALAQDLKTPQEQQLLISLAHEKVGPSAAVHTAKKATKTVDHFIPEAFPRLNLNHVKGAIEPALAHAIIRQESRFKHDAVSTAGAVGLMQLMPKTAQDTAKKHKVKTCKLTDVTHNTKLGCYHLKDLLDKYRGSIILAAAAYNAGADAVNSWLDQFGDPRNPNVDSIDWVELIPYAETRNYVQRVVENYNCYQCL